MKKITLFIFLFISSLVHAGIVTKDQAMQKGAQFMTSKRGVQKVLTPTTGINRRAGDTQKEPFYVFNIDGGGFVIVSGDDRTVEILGYSENGTFDVNNIPDNMRGLLQEYAEGIQYLDDHNIQVDKTSNRSVRRTGMTSIVPVMKQKWNQGKPYNNLCPEYQGKHSVTGCVATAMAQIMGHHRWPDYTTNPIPAYTTYTRKISVDGVGANTPISWSLIQDKYGYCYEDGKQYAYTDDQATAIAELMLYCGTSVEMAYDVSGSGAYTGDVIDALVNYFDYEEETCRWLDRVDYSYSEWQDIIYKELQENRPVLYSGQSAGGGHAFVVDGYDSEDFFHINWGWGSASDGYYRLCILNPGEQGIGGSTSSEGYGTSQGCGIGIKPNDGVVSPASRVLTVSSLWCSLKEFTRTNATSDFTVSNLYSSLWNSIYETLSFEVGVRILDSNGDVKEELSATNDNPEQTLDNMGYNKSYWYTYSSIKFGKNYADGNYTMLFVSRLKGTTTWYPCKQADRNVVNFTINGNTLTITNEDPVYSLAMTSYTVEGQKKANQELTVKVTAKNEGTAFRGDIYAYVNLTKDSQGYWDYDASIPAGFLEIDHGESQSFEFKFTPKKAGVNTITIEAGGQQIGEPIGIEIEAVEGPRLEETDFQCSPKLHYNDGGNYVYGNYAETNTTIKNTGDADFTGTISVTPSVFYSGQWEYLSPESRDVTIPAGETYSVYKYIYKYNGVSQYKVTINYQIAGDDKVNDLYTSPAFEFRDVPVKLSLSDASVANSNDESQTISGNTFSYSATITNSGTEDFNGKLLVQRWEYLPSTKKWNRTVEYVDFAVAAGHSEPFAYSFDNPGKETDAKYDLSIYYVYDDESFSLAYTASYYFVDENSPANVIFNRYEENPYYNYDNATYMYYYGRNVDFSVYLTNIGGQTFKGKVRVTKCYYFSDAGGYLPDSEETEMSIASGEMGKVSFTINKGDITYQNKEPDIFWFTVEIKGDADDDYKQIYRCDYFELRPVASINVMSVVAANDNGGTISGNTLDLSITLQNSGDADLSSGRLECNFYAINTSTHQGKWIETKNIENIVLAVGGSDTYNVAFDNPNEEGFDAYCVEFWFENADNNTGKVIAQTGYYKFSTTGIDTMRFDTTGKKADVYDIGGRKVGSTDQMQLLRPGLYIVNGKKVVKK